MDIQKERKAFENHLKKMGKTDNETFSKNEDDSYQMDIIHFGWKIWQAAKAHEAEKLKGCVVVPVEPTYKQLDVIKNSCVAIQKADLSDLEAHRLYRDAIGVINE